MNAPPQPAPATSRKAINVSLDEGLVSEARALGINISRACEAGLVEEFRRERSRRWREENRAALEAWNEWVDQNGLPLEADRLF